MKPTPLLALLLTSVAFAAPEPKFRLQEIDKVEIGYGLAPLGKLAQQIETRQADALTPVSLPRVPAEIAPVLDALRSHEGGGQEAEAAPALLMSRFGFGQSRARALLDWMRAQAWLN